MLAILGAGPAVSGAARTHLNVRERRREKPVARRLNCPCGEYIEGDDEDDLVAKTQEHLAEKHPGHDYTREQILFLAY